MKEPSKKPLSGVSKDPKSLALEYLKKHGFHFEMEVAESFRNAGFRVSQSEIYIDPITEKPRETDIEATLIRTYDKITFVIRVIVEYKYGKNPWIVFPALHETFKKAGNEYFYVTNQKKSGIFSSAQEKSYDFLEFYINKKDVYGVTVAQDGKDDVSIDLAYKAVQSLLSSINSNLKQQEKSEYKQTFEVFIPVIALKGKLFESYREAGEIICNEIGEAQLIWKNVVHDVYPKIEIVTDENVELLSKKLFKMAKLLTTNNCLDDFIKNYLN